MNANNTNPLHGFEELKEYADNHHCFILGECRKCRVITNTRHGRKESICNVVRAYKKSKQGKRILGYIVGFDEIEFKPDKTNYVYVKV